MGLFRLLAIACLALCSAVASAQTDLDQTIAKVRELVSKYKFNDAQNLLKNYLKHNPNCGRCYLEMAGINFQMEDGSEALKSLDKAIAVADTDEIRAEAHRYKGLLLMQGDKKQLAKSEQEFRQALLLSPKANQVHLKLGLVLIRENKQDEGIAELRTFVETGSDKDDLAYAQKLIANPRLASETPAPDFAVKTVDGRTIR